MIIRFSKTERMAGLFVSFALGGFLFFSIVLAYNQGWFSSHHLFRTTFPQGEGLHPGTLVQMAGLRAGRVESVSLDEDNRISVTLRINHEFKDRIKSDSMARVIRPFVIGDKVVEISVGSKEAKELAEKSVIPSEDTLDLMDMMGGGKLGNYLKQVNKLIENLEVLIAAFSDPKRSQNLIGMFDEILPLMQDFRELSHQMTTHKNLKSSMQNLALLTEELQVMMPEMAAFSKQLPALGASGVKTMEQLARVTEELNKILPVVAAVAPQLPEASQKSVEALKEAVIVLKAMQKSFLLRGAVKDVHEEETAAATAATKNEKNNNREPGSQTK